MQVLLATMNKGKVMELEELLNDEKIEILSLSDLPNYQEVEESGSTFAENAFIKARAACAAGKMITLADDSGLEVDALAGAPGIFSARYAGEPKNDEHNIEKLLTDLEGVPEENRTARFRCALAIICPDGQEYLTEGSVEGRILTERIGTGGFGYDPVFYLPDLQKTMAELSLDEKNCLSHRARAFAKAVPLLTALMKSF
ncbi:MULTISPECIES: XTP/dITP diphosphatase [Dehalobacter]|uniref:dITP/XTP pyrophosphatase n=1 Tax=Dehalobacter restrictus (strain DSM 9455 / PER-K23) TaxID=871738 RepID=A0ABN4BZ38_DEHRP|nr:MULTISPECIES: XTP/dITP diphosphatase [Dehalobacter]AHF10862.1 deoxyribonucleotide triphosphate pyrophosphatase [Dehalobacter restrictus DSM 9455]OCZ49725.1 non-canonical purine NTP pyrophosphatase, RdgB/HAM1 family [Dehalobacter sp. TeCB1]